MIQGTRNVLENCHTSILRLTGCVPGFTAAAAIDFRETTNVTLRLFDVLYLQCSARETIQR